MIKVYACLECTESFRYPYLNYYITTNPDNFIKYFEDIDDLHNHQDLAIYQTYLKYEPHQNTADDINDILIIDDAKLDMKLLNYSEDINSYFYLPTNLPNLTTHEELNIHGMYGIHHDANKYTTVDKCQDSNKYKGQAVMYCSECNCFYTYVCPEHPEQCYFSD